MCHRVSPDDVLVNELGHLASVPNRSIWNRGINLLDLSAYRGVSYAARFDTVHEHTEAT